MAVTAKPKPSPDCGGCRKIQEEENIKDSSTSMEIAATKNGGKGEYFPDLVNLFPLVLTYDHFYLFIYSCV